MSDLTGFLLARIAEAEEMARNALALGGNFYDDKPVKWHWISTNGESTSWQPSPVDPARVLAECEAKRRIAELHKINVEKDVQRGRFNETTREFEVCDYGYCYECDHDRDYGFTAGIAGRNGCETLRLLALPYADHPDYRPEWRP